MKKLKMIDLFSGVGGIRLGFEKTNMVETVFSSDIDPYACKTYEANFEDKALNDITKIKEREVVDHDILTAGFPCQAFSHAGNRKGFEDTRGTLFFDVARIVKAKKPKVVFLENVKGLVTHDHGNTFSVIFNTLKKLGYDVFFDILNTHTHGNIPQNRERIYIVAFRKDLKIKNFDFPKELKLTQDFKSFIKRDEKVDSKYYYDKRFSFFNKLKKEIKSQETAYQWRRMYVRKNQSNVCPTLTANMGTGGHNVPLILDNFGIRKLTPRECFNLQGFDDSFVLPKLSDAQLYKQAGNSVSVPVINRIAQEIIKVLK